MICNNFVCRLMKRSESASFLGLLLSRTHGCAREACYLIDCLQIGKILNEMESFRRTRCNCTFRSCPRALCRHTPRPQSARTVIFIYDDRPAISSGDKLEARSINQRYRETENFGLPRTNRKRKLVSIAVNWFDFALFDLLASTYLVVDWIFAAVPVDRLHCHKPTEP